MNIYIYIFLIIFEKGKYIKKVNINKLLDILIDLYFYKEKIVDIMEKKGFLLKKENLRLSII